MAQGRRHQDDRNATESHRQRQHLRLVRRVKLGQPQRDAHRTGGEQRDRGGEVRQQKDRQEGARLHNPDIRLKACSRRFRRHTVLSMFFEQPL
ncbi:Uncharacterised protein [Mycobacteroides abscessus subsp. massiliense]|nr:Uncharacterised protein [Mycobacteroides abscessus subsp. massiliense]